MASQIFVPVMACCQTAPSHYLNQCWLALDEVLQHPFQGNVYLDTLYINPQLCSKSVKSFEIRATSSRGPWASYQIRKIAGYACAGNTGNVFPATDLKRKPLVSDPGMHHSTCATHVPWCMSGSLTRYGGGNVPGIPGACSTRNFVYLVRGPWVNSVYHCLTLWVPLLSGLNKITVLPTPFAKPWDHYVVFWSKFHGIIFPKVQLTTSRIYAYCWAWWYN